GVRDSGIIAALALLGTLGQLLMTRAYASAPAGIVGPLGYTGVLFATGFGWAIWQERPDLATVTGALAIVAAGLLVMLPARRG
ncbi:MAG TPA: EamA family transporter, partial [Plasticicumulans sp.]|nr:EamA family transporter [Plasticicumulans sp.]